MRQTTAMRLAGLAFAALALTALTACGGDGDGTASPTATETTTAAVTETPPPTRAGTRVNVDMTEFAFALSQASFEAGPYTFVVRQQGQAPHALSIKGPGVDTTMSTEVIQPGGADETLAVTLQPGTYELWCPVGQHRQQGMETTITVR